MNVTQAVTTPYENRVVMRREAHRLCQRRRSALFGATRQRASEHVIADASARVPCPADRRETLRLVTHPVTRSCDNYLLILTTLTALACSDPVAPEQPEAEPVQCAATDG